MKTKQTHFTYVCQIYQIKNKKTRKQRAYILFNTQHQAEIWKTDFKGNAKQNPANKFLLFGNYSHSSPTLLSKNNGASS